MGQWGQKCHFLGDVLNGCSLIELLEKECWRNFHISIDLHLGQRTYPSKLSQVACFTYRLRTKSYSDSFNGTLISKEEEEEDLLERNRRIEHSLIKNMSSTLAVCRTCQRT